MSRLEAHGVRIEVPSGWEAELSVQPDPSTLAPGADPLPEPLVVLHTANFSLPVERGDYGSGAVETMGRNGIFATLIEFDRESATTALFARQGLPAGLPANDFAPDQLQLAVPGQSGLQQFFRVASRPFCLYAVIGSHSLRAVLVSELNRVLSGLRIR